MRKFLKLLTQEKPVLLLSILIGIIYAATEAMLDRYALDEGRRLTLLHDAIEWSVPILLGLAIGVGFNQYRYQKKLNRMLSTQNSHLKSTLLTNTLMAYILHEIRNPIHNLLAVLDRPDLNMPKANVDIVDRNLKRLDDTTRQISHIGTLSDVIDPTHPVYFPAWADEFVRSCAASELRKWDIKYEQRIPPLTIYMHPLLLEQCFTILFDNAITAVRDTAVPRSIALRAHVASNKHGHCEIVLTNTGACFPPEVLSAGARHLVKSAKGSGFGLVLVSDTLKQIGGELALSNTNGQAAVTLLVPSEQPL